MKEKLNKEKRLAGAMSVAIAGVAFFTTAASHVQAGGKLSLEEIVVTAERRETLLQETPLSVQVFNETMLQEKSVFTVEDLATFTPGLSAGGDVEGGSIRPVFVIRGVGQTSGRDSVERGVGLYIDDIYIPRTTGSFLQLIDVERVEVLRGPQGTLFGRNSTGGAIRYITKKPTDNLEGHLKATYGSYDRTELEGLINVPLSDFAAARIQVGSFKRDGYLEGVNNINDRGDMDDTAIRAALRFEIGSSVTIDTGVSYQKAESFGPALKVIEVTPFSAHGAALNRLLVDGGEAPLEVNDPRFVVDGDYKWNDRCFMDNNILGFSRGDGIDFFADDANYCDNFGVEQKNTIAFFDMNWDLSDQWSLRSISGYVEGKSKAVTDWAALGTFQAREESGYESFSQEFQVNYSSDKLQMVGGLTYFTESATAPNANRHIFFAGPPTHPDLGVCCFGYEREREMKTDSFGFFGQAAYDLTDQLTMLLGLRYSTDEKELTVTRSNRPTDNFGRPVSASDDWSSTDYRVNLQYQINPDVMVYAGVTSGFKAGGFNDTIAASPAAENNGLISYDPEDVTSYELGLKSSWLDNRLVFNLTAFIADYSNLQLTTPKVQTFINNDGNEQITTVLSILNAGKVELSGFEGDLRFQATERLTLSAAFATLHQKYKELDPGSALLIPSSCVDPGSVTLDSCKAQDLGRAPSLQYSLGANYDASLGEGGLALSAAYSWTEEQETSNSTENSFLIDSYGVLNLRADYTPASEKWMLGVFATNVLDEYYYSSGSTFTPYFATVTAAVGRPREYGVQLKVNF